ncbi:MAG TPA: glucoamylase family protein [Terriglobia bacterium]|nr:glucoamylase family protein [Terriglobia bacterium]
MSLLRRNFLRQLIAMTVCMPFPRWGIKSSVIASDQRHSGPAHPPAPTSLSPDDDQFLQELEKANFSYFWEQVDPQTNLVRDRYNVHTGEKSVVASIAATGFGLTAFCIGEKRGFVSQAEARARVLDSLRFLWRKLPHHRGFFYHFANINTGERLWDSEVSSVDTAILLCGVLTCRQHFQNSEIRQLARQILNRVDWTWLSQDTSLLPHGWMPETGFMPYRWDNYSELMMMYLLGLGSSIRPLKVETWDAWKRITFEYDGLRYIGSFAPLFVHQYSQAWFDFRGKRDRYADYFQNSIIATDVHRRFCLELAKQFPDYSDDLWGITASDSEKGYVVWGGPPAIGPIDGTVVPSAAAGSLPFLPQAVMRVLRTIKTRYGANAWSRYGFLNAFNPLKNWYDSDVVGIDTGITLLMAENARTGFVWDTFMRNPEAQRGMERAGFSAYPQLEKKESLPIPSTNGSSDHATSHDH